MPSRAASNRAMRANSLGRIPTCWRKPRSNWRTPKPASPAREAIRALPPPSRIRLAAAEIPCRPRTSAAQRDKYSSAIRTRLSKVVHSPRRCSVLRTNRAIRWAGTGLRNRRVCLEEAVERCNAFACLQLRRAEMRIRETYSNNEAARAGAGCTTTASCSRTLRSA